jgi:predicted metalloendopeptidase
MERLDNTIPADRTRWGSFDELRQRTDADALCYFTNPTYKSNTDQEKRSIYTSRF